MATSSPPRSCRGPPGRSCATRAWRRGAARLGVPGLLRGGTGRAILALLNPGQRGVTATVRYRRPSGEAGSKQLNVPGGGTATLDLHGAGGLAAEFRGGALIE